MIQGPRISLRQWKDSDFALFADLNADPETMRFFPKTATQEESFNWAQRIRTHVDEHGWGLWAVDIGGAFAGCTGFMTQSYDAHFTPAKEIAWRLRKEFWGHGYATEAARVATLHAFEELNWSEIVALTTYQNKPSWRVMQKLGMTHTTEDDFMHPRVPEGHPLKPHCLYRLKNSSEVVDGLKKKIQN